MKKLKVSKSKIIPTCHAEQREQRMKASSVSVYCERGVSGSHNCEARNGQTLTRISDFRYSQAEILPSPNGRGSSCASKRATNAGEGSKAAFTLAEVFLPHSVGCRRAAFTLAEVLITLAIIGVVAAITLPALITNIQDRIKEKRVQNIQQKFSKATDKMLATSGLNGYDSTLDFVNELKNHLSIAKICENDELRNCWPTEKVTLSDGTEWEISKTTKAKNLKKENNDEHEWSDTVGIITGDGTSMILSYNKKCDQDPVATPSWDSNRSNSTNCVAAVYDWNGSSKPNQFGTDRADVLALNAGGLGSGCAIKVNGRCLSAPFLASTRVTKAECESMADAGYGNRKNNCFFDNDCWAGAVKYCGGVAKMASMEDLAKIASTLYEGNPTIGAKQDVSDIVYITGSATNLGFSEPYFSIWSGDESTYGTSYYRYFNTTTSGYYWNPNRYACDMWALCVNE